VTRSGHVDHLPAAGSDDPRQVGVEQVQAGGGAPVPEQARLHLRGLQRLAQQRVAHQIDLADGQIVRRPPVRVDALQLVDAQRFGLGRLEDRGSDGRCSAGRGHEEPPPFRSVIAAAAKNVDVPTTANCQPPGSRATPRPYACSLWPSAVGPRRVAGDAGHAKCAYGEALSLETPVAVRPPPSKPPVSQGDVAELASP